MSSRRSTPQPLSLTEKAVGVLRPLIESFSSPGDLAMIVFDHLRRSALCGRRYLGIEIESRYSMSPAAASQASPLSLEKGG